ncbi:MAG TPA: hypothetical protein VFX10_00405 [Nitrospira sp.]|nr:hypothetical protein [Nitrospira sp.]
MHPKRDAVQLCVSESRVPANHPLRLVKAAVDQVLRHLSSTFAAMYSTMGRSSIPPERLLQDTNIKALGH